MLKGSRLLKVLLAALTAAVLLVGAALPAAAMTVTFVRHGESEGNAAGIIDTSVPGPHITALGAAQSQTVAAELIANGLPYDAIYTSNMVRTDETAQPFAQATGLTPVALAGLREIGAGWFEGSSEHSGPGRIGYALSPALWMLGARSLPVPGGGNGMAFDARVDGALKVIEDSGAQNPVVFSHGATIMFWTMMNVDNPDLGLMLRHQLDNTEMVVIDGSAEEGWTLKSWAGVPVGPATLGTKLFVNVRDLVVTPQTAVYNVVQAFRTGDIRTIANALRDGAGAVLRAPVTFAAAVVRDVVDAVTEVVRPGTSDAGDTAPPTVAAARTSAPEPTEAAPEPEEQPAAEPVKRVRTAKKPAGIDRLRVLKAADSRTESGDLSADDRVSDDKAADDEAAGNEAADQDKAPADTSPSADRDTETGAEKAAA